MEIPNYDLKNEKKDFKQLHRYMPKDTFRMLLASPSGGGKNKSSLSYAHKTSFIL